MYKMIDCHLTETFQVHETPPVQETGREFATRSGDIQAVVRFITITINSSPSPPSITIHHHHPSHCQVHHHQFIIIITILQQHITYPGAKTKTQTSRAAKAADDVQVVEIWKAGGLHRAFNMKVNHKSSAKMHLILAGGGYPWKNLHRWGVWLPQVE